MCGIEHIRNPSSPRQQKVLRTCLVHMIKSVSIAAVFIILFLPGCGIYRGQAFYMSPQQALEYRLIDKIATQPQKAAVELKT